MSGRAIAADSNPPANPHAGATWTDAHGLVFCWCPPGKATITDDQGSNDEGAGQGRREVQFTSGFWMASTELTLRQAKALTKKRPNNPFPAIEAGEDDPIVTLTLNSIRTLVDQLNGTSSTSKPNSKGPAAKPANEESSAPAGWQYALPTEAEWEYACRAGSTAAYCFGDDASQLPHQANFADRSLFETAEGFRYAHRQWSDGVAKLAKVGQFKPNAWGLHDMHGNAWEFCENGVARGGAWCSTPEDCRSDSRTDQYRANVERMLRPWLGVRLVLRPNPS